MLNSTAARTTWCLVFAVLAFTFATPARADSGDDNALIQRSGHEGGGGVLPPNSHAYGKSMGEWSAEWWKWVFAIPAPTNPLLDMTGADVAVGQSGPVWFLGGGFCTYTDCSHFTIVRNATIPNGVALFFPIINNECSTLEGNGTTYYQLRSCASGFQDLATNMTCEVDGTPVRNLDRYRVVSPLFTYTVPDNNIFQIFGEDFPGGSTSPSVSDGVYLMLRPLSAGRHVIHVTGEIPTYNFGLDVTYNLKVGGGHDGRGVATPAGVTATSRTSWGQLKTIYR